MKFITVLITFLCSCVLLIQQVQADPASLPSPYPRHGEESGDVIVSTAWLSRGTVLRVNVVWPHTRATCSLALAGSTREGGKLIPLKTIEVDHTHTATPTSSTSVDLGPLPRLRRVKGGNAKIFLHARITCDTSSPITYSGEQALSVTKARGTVVAGSVQNWLKILSRSVTTASTSEQFLPWPGYWNEYPARYSYLLYNPSRHRAPEAWSHAGAHSGSMPDDHQHGICRPSNDEIREMNRVAVEAAMFIEKLPIFPDKDTSRVILPKEYEMPYVFDIPGLSFIWDVFGWHWTYWPGVADDWPQRNTVNPSKPETVVYLQTKNGHQPIGIMFSSGDTPGPAFGGCMTEWHNHEAEGAKILGYMLHVYTFGNPDGPYGAISCNNAALSRDCIDSVQNPLANPFREN